jgi:hypothetical protein
MKQSCLGIIVAIGLTLAAFGQGVDPLIGSWKLNLENSAQSTGTGAMHSPNRNSRFPSR